MLIQEVDLPFSKHAHKGVFRCNCLWPPCKKHDQYRQACLWLLQFLLNEMISQKCEPGANEFELVANMYANRRQSHMVEDVLRRWVALGRKVGLRCTSDVVHELS